ncbi:hypothetical protein T492DRAFT_922098 [Pavlovales sp. CCMP2436]|nr:hypothetical protein T492DRAFT_922098 [Pavlovales sp. CCMP2436]
MSVIAVSLALNAVAGLLKVCVLCRCLCLVWYLCVCWVSVLCLMCLYGAPTSKRLHLTLDHISLNFT